MTTPKTVIPVFSVWAGAGHVGAAQAIQAAAEKWYPDVEVIHIDLLEIVPELFRKIYSETYIKIIEKHPAFWGYLYARSDREKVDSALSRLRLAIERFNTRKLQQLLKELNPDHVICTHFLPAALLSRKIAKGSFNRPVWVQVTDFDLHALWVQENLSGYFAASDEVAWRMSRRGINADTVTVSGIPIMPVFSEQLSRRACAAEFDLDPDKTTMLMMSGGNGVGDLGALALELMKLDGDFQLIALAGKNDGLLSALQAIASRYPKRLFPMGFTRVIERLMAASDLAITKPGGLTTAECLAVGLPMVVVSPIPGQEERNADFLLENGAALKAPDADSLIWRIKGLLNNPARLQQMGAAARALGKGDAARRVLERILSPPE